jgi:hypothetical protein
LIDVARVVIAVDKTGFVLKLLSGEPKIRPDEIGDRNYQTSRAL